ncbi:MAG: coproporphyrinogen III oxidase family protein, partial [Leptospiraceae bacterium]|nr:coproporphyrinogen III oxidase family protein [Leptospiraceae bacterium]
KQLDRYFDIEKYTSLMETLSSSIIERFGIDLIYGIPGQTEEDFYNDINLALGHGVNHLSAYSLTVEKGTKYSRNIKDKLSSTPDEELQIRILENLPEFLLSKGLNQYEVSNYSFAGMESRHNRKYWTMEYYLALGPGAHGFLPQGRYFNSRSIESYLSGKFGEKYEDGFSLEEFALCIFRNFSPIDMESFFKGLNFSLEGYYELFEKWKREGLCYWDGKIFKWNNKVILNLDNLIFEFVNFKSYLQTN